MDAKNGAQPQMDPPSLPLRTVTKDRQATADKLQIYTDEESTANGHESVKKKIKYPQITQITQISVGASDTVKDRTSRQRTLETVQGAGQSYPAQNAGEARPK